MSTTRGASRTRGNAGDRRATRRRRECLIAAADRLAVGCGNYPEVIRLIRGKRSERHGVCRHHRGVKRRCRAVARRRSILNLRRCRDVRRPINLRRILCNVRCAHLQDRRRSWVGITICPNQSSAPRQNQIHSEECGANKPRGPFANFRFSFR